MWEYIICVSLLLMAVWYFYPDRTKHRIKNFKEQEQSRVKEKTNQKFYRSEVAMHNHKDSLWLIVDNKVYNVTHYVDEHPGGDSILNNGGKDNTAGFYGSQHPSYVGDLIKKYYVGDLID